MNIEERAREFQEMLAGSGYSEKYNDECISVFNEYIDHLRQKLEAAEQINREAREQKPVAVVKTIGGYPDDSEHKVEWLVRHKETSEGDMLFISPVPSAAIPHKEYKIEPRKGNGYYYLYGSDINRMLSAAPKT
jgi:hypothetical protein